MAMYGGHGAETGNIASYSIRMPVASPSYITPSSMQRMNSHAEFSFRSGQILNLQGGGNRGIYELSMEDAMIKADFGRGISIIILLNAVEAAGGYSTEQTGNAEGNLYVMIFIHPSTACCLHWSWSLCRLRGVYTYGTDNPWQE
ncbi:hypothetical protein TEQG_07679 [Trichophyton equinum CBS 127.97]|uniref:Uncharacterized protein n=1 Tax=Trichophyton equinum (strain ATCC MYA-4606 / CBS 127.97) TaxID=559882 RepID=F2Q3K2_TRIEC|nr:hypothetical protein TEQG_07679 [Trichophyton equinum CBS 127.97]